MKAGAMISSRLTVVSAPTRWVRGRNLSGMVISGYRAGTRVQDLLEVVDGITCGHSPVDRQHYAGELGSSIARQIECRVRNVLRLTVSLQRPTRIRNRAQRLLHPLHDFGCHTR